MRDWSEPAPEVVRASRSAAKPIDDLIERPGNLLLSLGRAREARCRAAASASPASRIFPRVHASAGNLRRRDSLRPPRPATPLARCEVSPAPSRSVVARCSADAIGQLVFLAESRLQASRSAVPGPFVRRAASLAMRRCSSAICCASRRASPAAGVARRDSLLAAHLLLEAPQPAVPVAAIPWPLPADWHAGAHRQRCASVRSRRAWRRRPTDLRRGPAALPARRRRAGVSCRRLSQLPRQLVSRPAKRSALARQLFELPLHIPQIACHRPDRADAGPTPPDVRKIANLVQRSLTLLAVGARFALRPRLVGALSALQFLVEEGQVARRTPRARPFALGPLAPLRAGLRLDLERRHLVRERLAGALSFQRPIARVIAEIAALTGLGPDRGRAAAAGRDLLWKADWEPRPVAGAICSARVRSSACAAAMAVGASPAERPPPEAARRSILPSNRVDDFFLRGPRVSRFLARSPSPTWPDFVLRPNFSESGRTSRKKRDVASGLARSLAAPDVARARVVGHDVSRLHTEVLGGQRMRPDPGEISCGAKGPPWHRGDAVHELENATCVVVFGSRLDCHFLERCDPPVGPAAGYGRLGGRLSVTGPRTPCRLMVRRPSRSVRRTR